MTTHDPAAGDVEELPAVDTDYADGAEHPDTLTDLEAASGREMYERIDDLDDDSNGLDDGGGSPMGGESAKHEGPHSRACGWRPHDHGAACHPNCPTCGGESR